MSAWDSASPLQLALDEHLNVCHDTYNLLQEENRLLKGNGESPDAAFFDRKRQLIARLEISTLAIKRADKADLREVRTRAAKSQDLVMKTLLLDRENEQLLRKNFAARRSAPSSKPSLARLREIYGKY